MKKQYIFWFQMYDDRWLSAISTDEVDAFRKAFEHDRILFPSSCKNYSKAIKTYKQPLDNTLAM